MTYFAWNHVTGDFLPGADAATIDACIDRARAAGPANITVTVGAVHSDMDARQIAATHPTMQAAKARGVEWVVVGRWLPTPAAQAAEDRRLDAMQAEEDRSKAEWGWLTKKT